MAGDGNRGTGELTEGEIIGTYKELRSQCSSIAQKIGELEMERNEHGLVIHTLKPLDPARKAYRLIGGVLVERNVKEVLPAVEENQKNLGQTIAMLTATLEKKEKEANEWQRKYNIRTQDEVLQEEAAKKKA